MSNNLKTSFDEFVNEEWSIKGALKKMVDPTGELFGGKKENPDAEYQKQKKKAEAEAAKMNKGTKSKSNKDSDPFSEEEWDEAKDKRQAKKAARRGYKTARYKS